MADTQTLQTEIETFEKNREALIAAAEGKFALVFDGEVRGTYNDERDAIAEGYKAYGNVPFLVRQILPIETPINFVSSNLGF